MPRLATAMLVRGGLLALGAAGLDGQTTQVVKLERAPEDTVSVPKADIVPDASGCTLPRDGRLTAEVKLRVDATGRPERVALGQSSGDPCLDRAALAAVSSTDFYPAEKRGKTVSEIRVLLIDFGGETVGQTPRPRGVVTAPHVLRQTMLSFGTCAVPRDSEYHARVTLVIDVHGVPARAAIAQSTGDPCLDAQAVRSARGYLFEPARRDGVAVPVQMMIELQFNN